MNIFAGGRILLLPTTIKKNVKYKIDLYALSRKVMSSPAIILTLTSAYSFSQGSSQKCPFET